MSYLSKGEQASWRKRLQWAYNRPEYEEALTALEQLHGELEERNQSAAGSLEEGLEETLTLHRLGVHAVLGRSFKTTNCLESVNALVEERCAKVDHWKNSSQRQRWLATDVSRGPWKKNGALHSVIRVSDQAATSACSRTSLRRW